MGIHIEDQGFLKLISTSGDYIDTLYSFLGNIKEWFILWFCFLFLLTQSWQSPIQVLIRFNLFSLFKISKGSPAPNVAYENMQHI